MVAVADDGAVQVAEAVVLEEPEVWVTPLMVPHRKLLEFCPGAKEPLLVLRG